MNFKNMVGHCKCCGQCCSAFYVDMSPEQLQELADKDKALGLTMLESDAIFIIDNCIPLSPEEALKRSSAIAESPSWPQRNYWTCNYFRDMHLCQLDLEGLAKPHVCKGYPWYGKVPQKGKWLYPDCGYDVERELDVRQFVIKNNDLPANLLISSEEIKRVLAIPKSISF